MPNRLPSGSIRRLVAQSLEAPYKRTTPCLSARSPMPLRTARSGAKIAPQALEPEDEAQELRATRLRDEGSPATQTASKGAR